LHNGDISQDQFELCLLRAMCCKGLRETPGTGINASLPAPARTGQLHSWFAGLFGRESTQIKLEG
jgi:hypothetical protein